MSIEFGTSPRGTLGLEWELALIDKTTAELKNVAPAVLQEMQEKWPSLDKKPQASAELLQNTIELVSAPHTLVKDAVADLQLMGRDLIQIADNHDAAVIAPGCHPFSSWKNQLITDNKRYKNFIENTGWWGRNMLIWGVHTHLGIDNRDKVIPIMHALMAYQPHLIALSASSPFWEGENTGYMSNRTMLFQQLSTAGVPFEINNWQDFERVLGDLNNADIITEATEARWDVRPAPRWGTVEVRTCDGASTLHEIGAIAAISQCLVEDFNRRLDRGENLPRLKPWFIRENKWRSARFGTEAQIVTDNEGNQSSLFTLLTGLCERLTPIAQDLGCAKELSDAAAMVAARQTSAQRQLTEFQKLTDINGNTDQAFKGVVRMLATEFKNSVLSHTDDH